MGVGVQRQAPAVYLQERTSTHCEGGYVGMRAGLDMCGKTRPPLGFDPRAVQPVAGGCRIVLVPAANYIN